MGNAFDQAELMIELLREAGYTASYQLGDLETLEADAAAIFGTDTNIWAISNLLAVGGIPNSTYWNWPNWYIRFTHCWVKITISGTDYVFHPALKAYTAIAGMNMDTALNDWDNVDTNDTALAMHGISFEEGIMNEILDLDGVSSTVSVRLVAWH